MNLRTGFDNSLGDDGPWKPPASTIEKIQGFLMSGNFPFDYSLARYVCQICKRHGNEHETICCDGRLDTQNRATCGVSFHKLCADPMRQKPWHQQTADSDNFFCDRCYDDLFASDNCHVAECPCDLCGSDVTEEHSSDCDCGDCESEYIDSDGNLADFVVPDDDPSCEEEQHSTDCDCDFCQEMHTASEEWVQMRLREPPNGVARSVGDAIDRLREQFGDKSV